jgi:potassium channel subfamily K
MNYEPLIAGMLLPISTFINVQSITVPVWERRSDASLNRSPGDEPFIIWILANASLACGIIATIALFTRMLERKIKGCTRLFIAGSLLQGVISIMLVFVVVSSARLRRKEQENIDFTESLVYSMIAGVASLTVGVLSLYQQYLHRNQVYVYLEKEISLSQRQVRAFLIFQLILLTITTLGYLLFSACLYSYVEDWDFDDGLYFSGSCVF